MTRRTTHHSSREHRLPVRVVHHSMHPHAPAGSDVQLHHRQRWNRAKRAQIALISIGIIVAGIIVLWIETVGRSLFKSA